MPSKHVQTPGSRAARWLAVLLSSLLAGLFSVSAPAATPAKAAKAAAAPAGPQFVDGIAAVVNKDVITLSQVEAQLQSARSQLRQQKIQVPPDDLLRKQVLQRMINQKLERQEADRLGIRVTDANVQRAVATVAQRNRLTEKQLRAEIEKSGVKWADYQDSLRDEVRMDMLRQRVVDSHIIITDAEIDAFLRSEGGQAAQAPAPSATAAPAPAASGPEVLGLAHILVAVPEGASATDVDKLRRKAESLLAKVRGGADFASVAASSSDGPQALDGGNLGVRPLAGWPDLFVQASGKLKAGQVSNVIQSGNGFHIIKVLTRGNAGAAPARAAPRGPSQAAQQAPRGQQGAMVVTQTHARHILIKTSKIMSDSQARTRLEQLRQRIAGGESFENLARRNSEDSSAPQGGDLGWLSPGDTVPAFEQVMDSLQPGQVSEPVQSQFGWHLIQVIERRTKDVSDDQKRMQARRILFERRVEPAFEEWLNQLRGQAYIDNRLDPSASSGRR